MMNNFKKTAFGAVTAAVAITVLAALGGSFYTVDQGERGVILRNGKLVGTAEPGLGMKIPVFDKIVPISVKSNSRQYDKLSVYSSDQQSAVVSVSVSYRLPADQVDKVYSSFGSEEGILDRMLDRQVPEEVRNVFGQFKAETSIKERSRLSAEIQAAIKKAVVGPIIIESVQVEDNVFSKEYEKSIENRMLAEVEVQKVTQNKARESVQAETKVIQAQAEADSKYAIAEAEAKAIRMRGEAEAKAIEARGRALRDNPNLINLVTAERWDGALPGSMPPGGTVPFINVNPK